MARPVWTGTISFGLVAIPVKMFHAVRRRSVSFNQLDERNMARIRYRKVNAETGEEVSDDRIVKGFEFSKGQYVVVDPDELESVSRDAARQQTPLTSLDRPVENAANGQLSRRRRVQGDAAAERPEVGGDFE